MAQISPQSSRPNQSSTFDEVTPMETEEALTVTNVKAHEHRISRAGSTVKRGSVTQMASNRSASVTEKHLMKSAELIVAAQSEAKKDKKNARRMMLFGLLMAFFLCLTCVANFVIVFAVVDEAVTTKASSDGTMRSKDGENVVKTDKVASYTSLGNLPRQTLTFLDKVHQMTLVVNSEVRKYTIIGYRWSNCSSMVLETSTPAKEATHANMFHEILVHDNKAWIDLGTGNFAPVSSQSNVVRKALEEGKNARHLSDHFEASTAAFNLKNSVFTWDQLVAEHKSARRVLAASGGDALYDLYEFFGGVVEADLSLDSVDLGSCAGAVSAKELSTPVAPPTPDVPLKSKWITKTTQEDGTLVLGEWYMDISNIKYPKFHIVSHYNGTAQHEIVTNNKKFMYTLVDVDSASVPPEVASIVYNEKTGCSEEESPLGGDGEAGVEVLSVSPTDGTATWKVGGWTLYVSADGTILRIEDVNVLSIAEYTVAPTIGELALYETCDPAFDYHAKMEADFLAAMALSSPSGRQLGGCNWWSALMAYIETSGSYGNYCGKGMNLGFCTGSKANGDVCADGGADATCKRHDSGSYHQDVWGIATMNYCEVDRNFKTDRNADGLLNGFQDDRGFSDRDFKNGADCLFGVMPCIRYESAGYWAMCSGSWGISYPCRRSRNEYVTKWAGGNYPSGGCSGNCYK